jgi:NAD(P)-dependent dehydrogenase (short-subunit alcohol dehydrogenase family)
MENVLITGANRGFGLEFTRQYVTRGDHVFATCRNPTGARDLQRLQSEFPDRLTIIQLDVSNQSSIDECYEVVRNRINTLDILINNAGIRLSGGATLETSTSEWFGSLQFDGVLDVLRVNAVAPILIAQRFLSMLTQSQNPRIINISSWLGSIAERTPDFDNDYGYSGSKAALNMFSRILALRLAKHNIIVTPLDPGWARTDMGGEEAEQDVDESVSHMIKLIDDITLEQSGRFLRWDGGETAW